MPSTHPNATRITMSAILGPTPGSAISPSIVDGIAPPCSSLIVRVASLMKRTLLLWKPTARISSSSASSDVARMLST
eukprot:2586069-Prymnesium_polylepis.2